MDGVVVNLMERIRWGGGCFEFGATIFFQTNLLTNLVIQFLSFISPSEIAYIRAVFSFHHSYQFFSYHLNFFILHLATLTYSAPLAEVM